jgi:hypothetical protein
VVDKPSIPSDQHRVENDQPPISIDRPSSDKSSSDRPSTDRPSPDKPRPNKPNATKSPPTFNKSATPNAKSPSAPEWFDVLALLDLAEVPPQRGNWSRDPSGLKYSPQANMNGVLELPFTIRGSYQLRMDFTAAGTGTGFGTVLAFPVSSSWVRLVLDSGKNHVTGLDRVKEQPAGDKANNTSTNAVLIDREKKHHLELNVTARREATVEVKIDGKPVFKWEGSASDLSLPSTASSTPQSLQLLGFYAYTIHTLQLKSAGNGSIQLFHALSTSARLPTFVKEPLGSD